MSNSRWKNEILTIPNFLSLFRLLLIPLYILIYLNAETPGHYFLSAAILAVSCLTDMIDGKIARKYNMSSTVGKILDPVADKATQFALILCLAVKYSVLKWLMGLFVLKESFQLVAGCINLRKRRILKGALITGKICTTILFVSLILLVLLPNMSPKLVHIITLIDAFFMLISLIDYVTAYFCNRDKIQDL